jgi:diguanylate cyclase (GGDEF)-like protein
VIDRRALVAVAGGALAVMGAVLAVVWSPIAAVLAALGALVATGVALVLARPESRPTTAPTAPTAGVAPDEATAGVAGTVPEPVEPAPEPANTNGSVGRGLLIDPDTGLFTSDYFDVAIEARVAAARRHLRPVGVVLLEVVEGLRAGHPTVTEPRRVAEAIQETLREADTACRREDGRFALLLEDTPENGAIWTVERIRRYMAERDPSLTLWAGVACYPAHAFDSASLLRLAGSALDTAREWRQDRIEVAAAE